MRQVQLPEGRTKHQPIVWRCANPECARRFGQKHYDFTTKNDHPKCPQCGAEPPYVAARALIHLLVPDERGPIPGEYGVRYKILCEPTRAVMATERNQEACSGDFRVVNCGGCLALLGSTKLVSGQTMAINK